MEDVLSTVLRGCVMARELEVNLVNAVQHPNFLLSTCDQIAATFASAAERLSSLHAGEEYVPPVGLVGTVAPEVRMGMMGIDVASTRVNVGEEHEMDMSGSRLTTGSLVHRSSRKRKAKESMRTIKVPAPRMGNLDVPPDDGYTWRKYGQKLIFGAGFPRSYYRCTHKSFYGCEAKKQVQRLDHDPFTFEVTYFGNHTCQTTTTPLAIPSTITPVVQVEEGGGLHQLMPSSSSSYLPTTTTTTSMSGLQFGGSSTTLQGRAEFSIADMVDEMFNFGGGGGGRRGSGGGGGNVMEDFFSSK